MWAKFEMISSYFDVIILPSFLLEDSAKGRYSKLNVIFGIGAAVPIAAEYTDEAEPPKDNTFENPILIKASKSFFQKLHIPESLIYQVKIENACIFIGPVIGLLLGTYPERYTPKHMRKYSDRMGIYNQIGGLIYAFSTVTINWVKHEASGLFYNISNGQWEYGYFPLPEVIYRRDFHQDPMQIRRLMDLTDGQLFNSYRFSKLELYNYIYPDESIRDLLPPTEPITSIKQIMGFIDRYEKVILKPVDLSRGRGICIINKDDLCYKIIDYRSRNPITCVLDDQFALEKFFDLNQMFFEKYLIQKQLNLAKIGDSVFDIRVVMQKTKLQTWECTGTECRVSNDSLVTNISRGGYALTLKDALEKSFGNDYQIIADKIYYDCHEICERLDKMGHHFAELGLDIAVDEEKRIWLIEANVFPSFKGFKTMDLGTYLSIRYTPLQYALSLTKFGIPFKINPQTK